MNQLAIDFSAARAAADLGMRQAIERAERLDDTFPARAEAFIFEYALTHKAFISEELTAAAAAFGIVPAGKGQAWGMVFRRASTGTFRCIKRIGHGISLRRHGSPCPLWGSLVYGGGQ